MRFTPIFQIKAVWCWLTAMAAGLFLLLLSGLGPLRLGSRHVTIFALRLPSGHIFLCEDPHNPRLRALRRQEGLDNVVRSCKTDMDRVLALAKWTSSLFKTSTPFPNYPAWDALTTLRMIRARETGGFCAQYAFIFGQACQSLGYPVVYIDLASKDGSKTHFIAAVYVNSEKRWVAFDPQKGVYYVDKEGNPLDIGSLHQYAVGLNKGTVFEFPGNRLAPAEELSVFQNFRIYLRNNFLTVPVFVRYQRFPHGVQMLFEPYRLKWTTPLNESPPESNTSFTTQSDGEIAFPLDLSVFRNETCDTEKELEDILRQSAQGSLYKIKIPKDALWRFVEQKLVNDSRYRPLLDAMNPQSPWN